MSLSQAGLWRSTVDLLEEIRARDGNLSIPLYVGGKRRRKPMPPSRRPPARFRPPWRHGWKGNPKREDAPLYPGA